MKMNGGDMNVASTPPILYELLTFLSVSTFTALSLQLSSFAPAECVLNVFML